MSRTKDVPRPEPRLFLEIQPTLHMPRWSSFAFFILISFPAAGGDAIELERAASQWWLSGSTMVLSEAHGLWLFLVIREGIT